MQKKPTQPPKPTPPQKVTRPAAPPNQPPSGPPNKPPGRPANQPTGRTAAQPPSGPPGRPANQPPGRTAAQPPSGPPGRPATPPPARPAAQPPQRPGSKATQTNVPGRGPATPPRAPNPAVPVAAAAAAGAVAAEALKLELDRFNALQPKMMLTAINDDISEMDSEIAELPATMEALRARGYVFKSYLERKVETLSEQWIGLRPQVQSEVQSQSQALRLESGRVQATLNRQQLATVPLTTLESKVEATQRNIRTMYDAVRTNVSQTKHQIDDILWTLQQIEQASFRLGATEAPVEAVRANWKGGPNKDGMEGVLFLTDQRLIFERNEEVATKKVLFIATAKERVHELAWEVTIGQVAKAAGSKRGFMNKDDYLTILVDEGVHFRNAEGQPVRANDSYARPLTSVEVHLKGEGGEAWQGYIGRVKSAEIDKERTSPVDAAVLEAVANAPTKCTTCGATITQQIVRGQTELTCEYCGSVMRL